MRTLRRLARNKPRGRFLEPQNLPQFRIEGLHDAVAGDGLMQNVLNLGKLVLTGARARAHLPADLTCRSYNDRNKQKQEPN